MKRQAKEPNLAAVCRQLGTTFNDIGLLQQALTHTSYANENKRETHTHNERLEFLGDAVLDLVISDYLFRQYPDLPEGELTKARAAIVCEPTLASRAAEMSLGDHLRLGRGEAASGGRERISILADAFEAVIGAIYLDQGFPAASRYVLSRLEDDLSSVERGEYAKDHKTLLQELAQRGGDVKIVYEVTAETGPDHDKVFEVAVRVNTDHLGVGSGKSKKEAEQQAARQALKKLSTDS